jgi:hypothetical protein
MKLSKASRHSHRWLGMLFTLTVVANFAAMAMLDTPPAWLTYLPLAPLAIMIPTGIHLFFVSNWYSLRARHRQIDKPR